ncbi:hypothetical protein EDB19DRAFT_1905028 [Suillus lakei]|nr:hypothetical protein EDB19DRAFT_1905028 [Suillus lakei]
MKLEAASSADQELIMQQPQCSHNVSNEPSGTNTASASQSILHRQTVHSREASQHRLNQPRPQNTSTSNASDVRRKVSALKANARAAKVDVDFTLLQYLAGSAKPSKLAIPSSRVAFATADEATTAFEQLALKARGLYESTLTLSGLSDAALDLVFDW